VSKADRQYVEYRPMENYPRTMLEFEKYFSDEASCREYLQQIRWQEGFICPHCDHGEYWIRNKEQYQCKQCRYRISATSGTIFQDTRIPLQLWFRAIWQMVSQKHGISAVGLQRVLGLNRYETTWNMLHRLRTAMVRPGRIRLHTVKDASGDSLIPAIKESVQPKSEICTDGWKGYNGLSTSGYSHTIIRETAEVGKNLLPLVNRVVSLLKRWLMGTHQGKPLPSHLDYYLDEFVFRFNRRTSRSRGLLFYRLIEQAVNIDPVKDQNIRGGRG